MSCVGLSDFHEIKNSRTESNHKHSNVGILFAMTPEVGGGDLLQPRKKTFVSVHIVLLEVATFVSQDCTTIFLWFAWLPMRCDNNANSFLDASWGKRYVCEYIKEIKTSGRRAAELYCLWLYLPLGACVFKVGTLANRAFRICQLF